MADEYISEVQLPGDSNYKKVKDSEARSLISTNRANILYNLNMGVKNLIRFVPGTFTNNVATFEITNDGKVIINSTSSGSSAITNNYITLPAGTYRQIGISVSGKGDVRLMNGSTRITDNPFTLSAETTLSVVIFSYATNNNVVITPMLCTEEAYAQSHDYMPPAKPNYDLTRLQSEDRAGLIECVDGGAKNVLQYSLDSIKSVNTYGTWSSNVYTYNGVKYTVNSDLTISLATVSGTTTHDRSIFWITKDVSNKYTQTYVLSGGNTIASADSFSLTAEETTDPWTSLARDYGGTGAIISATSKSIYGVYIGVKANYVISGTQVLKPMICTKAAFGVSNKFVPYYNPASPILGGGYDIPQNSSMDRLTSIGKWRCYNSEVALTVTNAPFKNGFFGWTTNSITDSARYVQIAISNADVFEVAKRRWNGTIWSDWEYISSDAVTHYKADTTTTIGTDWTLTSIVLQAPVDALVPMTVMALWGAKAPRGIRITRTNTSATNNVIATIEVSEDKGQIQASGFGAKLNGVNTYYVWAKAKESGTMPVYLTYSYPIKD